MRKTEEYNQTKFIVYEDFEIFTSHGCMVLKDLYDKYVMNNQVLPESLVTVGIQRGREYRFNIECMEEIYVNNSYMLALSGAKTTTDYLLVHPKQKFWVDGGKVVNVSEITQPYTRIVAKNGMLNVNSSGYIEEPKRYFILYCSLELRTMERIPSLIAGNLVLLPMENVDEDNPFFIGKSLDSAEVNTIN